jgi:hypothetical protein
MGEDARRLVLMGLLALWAVLWGLSVHALTLEPGARMTGFLGFQLAAALPAFAAWVIARAWPKGSGVRAVARVPLQLALGLAAVIGGLVLWAALMSAA